MLNAENLPSVYNPALVEDKWYRWWEEEGFFIPSGNRKAEPFSIVMPPPNVTGQLHLGHAIDNTMQDIIARFKRMQGFDTLWLPGTDHAGIATQAKVEEALAEQGISRYDLGREKFLERVWEWKNEYHGRITHQLRLLGSSCDWTRERFTMDEGCSEAVREVFVSLYEQGLIYQGDYIINWCTKCKTTISDIEVEHEEEAGHLWHIKYPVVDSDEYLVVATTRPETMLGDTGVAVHPEDERYRHLVGKEVLLPLTNRQIPIFADDYVDREFGTGAVKVTPAHDINDFEMGRRHSLDSITVINLDGTMNQAAGDDYQGLDRYQCRKKVVDDLKQQGFLVKIEDHTHAVGHCYRCDSTIEPMVSKQWFVRMKPLAEPAIERVLAGDTKFVPSRFTKVYTNWMENIRDWCISRQLWWGHRIPVWYCDCGEVIVSRQDPTVCPTCGSKNLVQDEDVLDTWFSSALWPFSTMGWPKKTADFKRYFPTTVLVTGRDIIFFWVARMIFSAIHHTGQVPFADVLIHGLILDEKGRKMSKSLGNGIDPLDIIDKYGADTLRFSLVTGNTQGNDVRFHMDKVENTRNFANKIWNASRFVIMNLKDYEPIQWTDDELTTADRWILTRVSQVISEVTERLEAYDQGEAARLVYDFIWDEFCDWYIELSKPCLYQPLTPRHKQVVQSILIEVLSTVLQLLHPFMPFITEEIYQFMPGHTKSIMISSWPKPHPQHTWSNAVEEMKMVMEVIRAIRNLRAEVGANPGVTVAATLIAHNKQAEHTLEQGKNYISGLAKVGEMVIAQADNALTPDQALSTHLAAVDIYLPLKGLVDIEKEMARLEKEMDSLLKDENLMRGKLGNEKFIGRAPAEVVAKEREKLEEVLRKKDGVSLRLQALKQL
ncbi:MAG: valine--tRNA ligase [Methylocystaceae bacterium]